jgi:hypothetical protein
MLRHGAMGRVLASSHLLVLRARSVPDDGQRTSMMSAAAVAAAAALPGASQILHMFRWVSVASV